MARRTRTLPATLNRTNALVAPAAAALGPLAETVQRMHGRLMDVRTIEANNALECQRIESARECRRDAHALRMAGFAQERRERDARVTDDEAGRAQLEGDLNLTRTFLTHVMMAKLDPSLDEDSRDRLERYEAEAFSRQATTHDTWERRHTRTFGASTLGAVELALLPGTEEGEE